MTRTFPAPVVASLTTRKLLCGFPEMHELIEFLENEPIWTHQLASGRFVAYLVDGVLKQHPALASIDPESITTQNYAERAKEIQEQFGDLDIEQLRPSSRSHL